MNIEYVKFNVSVRSCHLGKFYPKASGYILLTYKLYALHAIDPRMPKSKLLLKHFYENLCIFELFL